MCSSDLKQPERTARRLLHPTVTWQGGRRGFDRPLDRAFVSIQRRSGGSWHTVESDLGLEVLWQVNASGVYQAEWEPPYVHRLGTYRFRITANRYSLASRRFRLEPSSALTVRRLATPAGKAAVELRYPPPSVHEDVGDQPPDSNASLTARPARVAAGGKVTFVVDGHRRTVTAGPGGRFEIRAAPGANVKIPAGDFSTYTVEDPPVVGRTRAFLQVPGDRAGGHGPHPRPPSLPTCAPALGPQFPAARARAWLPGRPSRGDVVGTLRPRGGEMMRTNRVRLAAEASWHCVPLSLAYGVS